MVEIVKLSKIMGAEVRGVDPRKALTPDELRVINRAFVEHMVLRFRDAALSPQQLIEFSRNFGELQLHVAKKYRLPDTPEVVLNTNLDEAGNYDKLGSDRGVGWHSDLAYDQVPARATFLHATALPSRGGNTLFANMHMAYDAMPENLRRRVDGKLALFRLGGRSHLTQGVITDPLKVPTAIHPIIRVHPESGLKSVYANPYHTLSVNGMSRSESDALLDELFEWCVRPEFQWEQEWKLADTIMWENRSAWHSGRQDYPQLEARKFIRTTVRGTPTLDEATISAARRELS